eukprot:759767-Hanusia_phi.AAC.3
MCCSCLQEADAKVSLLWVLGQFGNDIPEAPYLIEPMIDEFEAGRLAPSPPPPPPPLPPPPGSPPPLPPAPPPLKLVAGRNGSSCAM